MKNIEVSAMAMALSVIADELHTNADFGIYN